MKIPSELDLELLEAYLDDALSPAQVEHLAQRLLAEPELAGAMHEVRAHRALRTAAWRHDEPTEAQAAKLAERIAGYVRRDRRRRLARRAVGVGAAVAAALAVFLAGWLIRGSGSSGLQAAPTLATTNAAHHPSSNDGAPPAPGFQVAIMDDSGRVVAVQKFARVEEARQFADDVMQMEARRRQLREGGPMLVSDRF